MLLALSLPKASVIVSEDRKEGILKAKELGAKIVFLDDGYRHHNIAKYDILVRPKDEPTNVFCLPSGGYRDTKMMYAFVDMVLKDGVDFTRVVTFSKNNKPIKELPQENLLLLTAISKPNRLLEYLPNNIKMISFEDHHNFTKNEIDNILQKYPNYNIVTTAKDMVKLEQFKLKNIYLMNLEIEFKEQIIFPFE
jgi:tetraacyldisaccharide 4'-kinase